MKQVSLFSQVAAISIGVFLFLAVLLGVSHAADIAYKFEIVDMPLPIGPDFVDGRHAGNNIAGSTIP